MTTTCVPRVLVFASWLWMVVILLLVSIDGGWEKIVRPYICEPLARRLFASDIQISYTFILVAAPTLIAAAVASLEGRTNRADKRSTQQDQIQGLCIYPPYTCFPTSCPNPGIRQLWDQRSKACMICRKKWFRMDGNAAAVLFVVFPCAMCFLFEVADLVEGFEFRKAMGALSNTAGFLALLSMSAFLIVAVIRHNYFCDAVGGNNWPPTKTIRLHVWAGSIAVIGTVFHGAVYLLDWFLVDSHDIGFWNYFIPQWRCFEGPWERDAQQAHTDEQLPCFVVQRNFTGVLGGVALVILGMSSMNWVRRTSYRLFYTLHGFCTPVILLMTALHGHSFFLYLVPALILWSSTTLPVLLESRWYRRPAELVSVETISSEEGQGVLYSVTFQVMRGRRDVQVPAGHYLQLRVPRLSPIAHPFSIVAMPKKSDQERTTVSNTYQLRFIFRANGHFTKQLGTHLTDTSLSVGPKLQIEMPYGAPLLPRILAHRRVKLIAGGVGITAFLSILQEFTVDRSCPIDGHRELELHWFCRDKDLIKYISEEYASNEMLDAYHNARVGIWIYYTGQNRTGQDFDRLFAEGLEAPSMARSARSRGIIHFRTHHDADTGPFSPVRASSIASGEFYRDNIRRFLLLVTNSLLGLCLTYTVYILWQSPHQVLSRLYAPILVVAQEFIVGLLFVAVTEKYATCHPMRWEPVPTTEQKENEAAMAIDRQSNVVPCPGGGFHYQLGRVPFVDVLDNSTDAVFFCGPNAMYQALRKIAGDIPVHKEEFEM